jgi:hypothetical protein
LAGVLAFVGGNMIADYFLPHEAAHLIPTWAKLLIIAGLLGISIVASIAAKRREARRGEGREERGERREKNH